MPVDPEKIQRLTSRPLAAVDAGELRREGDVLLVGSDLALQPTLETIFDSDCQTPVGLFVFSFADAAAFDRAEPLVRGVKKNFRGFLLGSFATPPSLPLIERSYAAGIDLFEQTISAAEPQPGRQALDDALGVFPRWGAVATLAAGEEGVAELAGRLDALLEGGILPLLRLTPLAAQRPTAELTELFTHLEQGWQRSGANLKPLQPLLALTTPLIAPPPRRGLGAWLDKAQEAQLRTSSDLRRLLRVRQVEESFESAGL